MGWGTPWYTWHIWYNDPVIWRFRGSFALIDILNDFEYSYSSWAGGTLWYTWHIWYTRYNHLENRRELGAYFCRKIHVILIRVVGWRDSLYATHAALACFTFPILSTLPWYISGIFTFSILSARLVRFPHTRRRPALYTPGLCPFNKTNSRRIRGYDTLILHTLGWHVYDTLILW